MPDRPADDAFSSREPPYTSLENAIVAYRCTTASQAFKHPRMTLLVNAHRPDLPVLSSPLAKNISLFSFGRNSNRAITVLHSSGGALRVVTNVECGMRWTLWVRKTSAPQGGRRSRSVLIPRRWYQVLKKLTHLRDDGDNKARSPGRLRRKSLKPSRRECRKRFGEPVVTNSYACFICMRGCGCAKHPAFPAPSRANAPRLSRP